MMIAQGQRGTSAALGSERKMICSPFSGLTRQPAGASNQKKGRVGTGWLLPRAATSAVLPWAIILLPLRGAGRADRVGVKGINENVTFRNQTTEAGGRS
jgi:hypothetical protein